MQQARWCLCLFLACSLFEGAGSDCLETCTWRFLRTPLRRAGQGGRRLISVRGGGEIEDFPTLDQAIGIPDARTANIHGESCDDVSSEGAGLDDVHDLSGRGDQDGAGLQSSRQSQREADGGGGYLNEGRASKDVWEMRMGPGEGMWEGSDYLTLQHNKIGSTVELRSQEEHFSFLFSCRRGGEVRAYLGASGVAFTSGFCASSSTLRDSARPVRGQTGSWMFSHDEKTGHIVVRHASGPGNGEIVLTTVGFVFFPRGVDEEAVVVEDAKIGRVGVAGAREMLSNGRVMLPFARQERVVDREEDDDAVFESQEEGAYDEGEGKETKVGDLLAAGRDTVTGYDGVLEPDDEVMALRRERRDERGGESVTEESEEEERRRAKNVMWERPEELDSSQNVDHDEEVVDDCKEPEYGEFMRPLGEEWQDWRHPTGKAWKGVGPELEDPTSHTQFSYKGMSLTDIVDGKFAEKDKERELHRRAREDLIENGLVADEREADEWLRARGVADEAALLFDIKHALLLVEKGEAKSVKEAFEAMDADKEEYEGYSEGDIDQTLVGTGKFEALKAQTLEHDAALKGSNEDVYLGDIGNSTGQVVAGGAAKRVGIFLGGLQVDPKSLDEWDQENLELQERMGPPHALQAAVHAQKQIDGEAKMAAGIAQITEEGESQGEGVKPEPVALMLGGKMNPLVAAGVGRDADGRGEDGGRRICYFDEWDGGQEGKMVDADVLESVVTAAKRSARLSKRRRRVKKQHIGVIDGGMIKSNITHLEGEILSLEAKLAELKLAGKIHNDTDISRKKPSGGKGILFALDDGGCLTAENLLKKGLGMTVDSVIEASKGSLGVASAAVREQQGPGAAEPGEKDLGLARLAGAGVRGSCADDCRNELLEDINNKGVWGQGRAAANLFSSVGGLKASNSSPAVLAIQEAVARASDLLKRAKDRMSETRTTNASSLYQSTPDWLTPVKLPQLQGDGYCAHDSANAGDDHDDDGEADEWDGDLTWAAGGEGNTQFVEDDGFVFEDPAGADDNGASEQFRGGIARQMSMRDAHELWDVVQGRGQNGYGYTVLRLRPLGTVVELFHDSDDGHFRFMPGKGLPREKAQDGSPLWKGTFTRQILACARWGDFWERTGFQAHGLVRRITERAGWSESRFPELGSVAAGLWTIQTYGPVLRVTWALDHDCAKPAVTYLTPDGMLHFGEQAVVQVSMGGEPMKLPRYMFRLPEDLTIKGKKPFQEELKARLEWYKSEVGSLPLLIQGEGQTLQSTARAPSKRPIVAKRRYNPNVDWMGAAPVGLPS